MAPAPADAGAGGRDAHYEERLSRLRGQNQQIINETVALKAKFRKSLQLLHVYQSKLVQVAEPPVARAGASTLLQSLAPGTVNIARGAAQTVKPSGSARGDDSVGCDSTAAPQHTIAKGALMPAGGLGAAGNSAGPLADLLAAPEGTDVGPIASAPRAQLLSPGAAAGPADGRQPQSAESLSSPPPFKTPPRPDESSSTAPEHIKPVLAQPQPQQPLSALTPAQLQKLALEAKRALDARSRAYEAWTSGPAPLGARSLEVGQSPQLPLQPPVHSAAGARAEAGGHAAEEIEGQHSLRSSKRTAGSFASHEGGEAEDAGISTPPARALPPPSPLARSAGRSAQAEAQQRAPDPQLPEEPPSFEPRTIRLARSPAEVPRADGWAGADGRGQTGAAEAAAKQRTSPQRPEPSGSRAREASRLTTGPAGPPATAASAALSVPSQRGTLGASEREPPPAPCAPAATQRGHTAGDRSAEPPAAAPRQHAAGSRAAQPPDLRPRGAGQQEVLRAHTHSRSHGEAGSPQRAGPGEGGSQSDSDTASLFDLIEALNDRGGGGGALDADDEAVGGTEPLRSLVDLIADLEDGAAAGGPERPRAGKALRAAPGHGHMPQRARERAVPLPRSVGAARATRHSDCKHALESSSGSPVALFRGAAEEGRSVSWLAPSPELPSRSTPWR